MGILSSMLILATCVAIHELGHMFAALAFGLRVKRLSVGLGPLIVGVRSACGEWRLMLPFGHDVRIGSSSHPARSYELRMILAGGFVECPSLCRLRSKCRNGSILWNEVERIRSSTTAARVVVSVAGPLANFVAASACYAAVVIARGGGVTDAAYAPVGIVLFLFGLFHRMHMSDLSGPVGMVVSLSRISGAEQIVGAVGALSAQFFLLNMIPLPPLDGGHTVAYMYEWVRGRNMNHSEQRVVYTLSMCTMAAAAVGAACLLVHDLYVAL